MLPLARAAWAPVRASVLVELRLAVSETLLALVLVWALPVASETLLVPVWA